MISNFVKDAKQYITKLLKPLKSKWYYFHNLDHTLDVFDRATYLLNKEWISSDFIELVQIATLFHDSWFLIKHEWHEDAWTVLFDEYFSGNENLFLKDRLHFYDFVDGYFADHEYSTDKIDIIKQLILATIPQRLPSNKLEWLIKDADIDNLGRDDFFQKSLAIKKEMEIVRWKVFTDKEWFMTVLWFVRRTKFYTHTQNIERKEKLKTNIIELENMLMTL